MDRDRRMEQAIVPHSSNDRPFHDQVSQQLESQAMNLGFTQLALDQKSPGSGDLQVAAQAQFGGFARERKRGGVRLSFSREDVDFPQRHECSSLLGGF